MTSSPRQKLTYYFGFVVMAAAVGLTGYILTIRLTHKGGTARSTCQYICVLLKDKAQPDTLSVKVGELVQFNSADGKTHNLALGKGGEEHEHTGAFNSGDIKADEGWRVTFKEPGTYYFHDHYNPAMNILVVVYAPN